MKFGLLLNTQDPPRGEHLVQRWKQILELARVGEASGFDGVFLPEHHMMDDGYLPSAWAALGALAASTTRIDIGTSVHLLPLEHPIHVAEHAAMVDILSNGRLRLGCGVGNFAQEFELFGLNPKAQASRFEEAIDLLQRAWAGDEIDHDGKHFQVKGRVRPLPIAAQLWLGAMSDPGVRRAARFGCRWITDPLHNIHVIRRWADEYERAADEYGTSGSSAITLMRYGWVADSVEEVEREWWPHLRDGHWYYFKNIPRWVAELEPTLQGVEREEDLKFDTHRKERLIAGTPDDCIAAIEHFRAVVDTDYMVLGLRVRHGPEFEKEIACIERFGRDVLPAISGRNP